MARKKKLDSNYLDKVPYHNPEVNFTIDEEGRVTLSQENKGLMKTITQKLINKPRFSKIHLDEMGNFIWPLIDGEKTVYDIAELVKEHFGEKAEPLYNRLVTYIDTLHSYGFVCMKGEET